MRKLILLFSLLATIILNAQATYKPKPTEFVSESNVFEVPKKTASEIYNLTKVWMAENYEKPDNVLVGDTKDVVVKIKYFFEIPSKKRSIKIKYNLILEFKDEKVKIKIINIEDSGSVRYTNFFKNNGDLRGSEQFGIHIDDIEAYVNQFVNNYLFYLNKNDNW